MMGDVEQFRYLRSGIGWDAVAGVIFDSFRVRSADDCCRAVNGLFASAGRSRYEAVSRLTSYFNSRSLRLDADPIRREREGPILDALYDAYRASLRSSPDLLADRYLIQAYVKDLAVSSPEKNRFFGIVASIGSDPSPVQSELLAALGPDIATVVRSSH
jgi:hypothetical protein